jgi:hypothetical protein
MRQTSGYAILQMPAALVATYDASMRKHQARELFQRLCETLEPLPRSRYRGISRFPLSPLPSTAPGILKAFEDTGCDVHTEYTARLYFLNRLGGDVPEGDFDEDLLPDIHVAGEVFPQLESPERWEIVQLNRESFSTDAECLGFDVGYWGGDHYSIICDSAVRLIWHPPAPECFEELAQQLQPVNEWFLFRSAADAARFRSWYRTQQWAETEMSPDQFCIIQVNKPRH